jgi:hypothetical protein
MNIRAMDRLPPKQHLLTYYFPGQSKIANHSYLIEAQREDIFKELLLVMLTLSWSTCPALPDPFQIQAQPSFHKLQTQTRDS